MIESDVDKTKCILLSDAIERMERNISSSDLSEEYLKQDPVNDLRLDSFGLEWLYGITMVPSTFALRLAKKVMEYEGDQWIPIDVS